MSTPRRLWWSLDLVVRGLCAHLARVVKSNSSGIEVWRGSLVQAVSRSRCVLDRGAVETLNPPQRGLRVTGKSSTPREKFLSLVWWSLALLFVAIYFEQFILLELEFILVILGCKPTRHRIW